MKLGEKKNNPNITPKSIKEMYEFLKSSEFLKISNSLRNIGQISEIKKFYEVLEKKLFSYLNFDDKFIPTQKLIETYQKMVGGGDTSIFQIGIDKGRLMLMIITLKLMIMGGCPENELEVFISEFITEILCGYKEFSAQKYSILMNLLIKLYDIYNNNELFEEKVIGFLKTINDKFIFQQSLEMTLKIIRNYRRVDEISIILRVVDEKLLDKEDSIGLFEDLTKILEEAKKDLSPDSEYYTEINIRLYNISALIHNYINQKLSDKSFLKHWDNDMEYTLNRAEKNLSSNSEYIADNKNRPSHFLDLVLFKVINAKLSDEDYLVLHYSELTNIVENAKNKFPSDSEYHNEIKKIVDNIPNLLIKIISKQLSVNEFLYDNDYLANILENEKEKLSPNSEYYYEINKLLYKISDSQRERFEYFYEEVIKKPEFYFNKSFLIDNKVKSKLIHDIQSLNESLTTIMEEISEKKRNNRDISSDTVRLNLELNQKRIDLNNINKKEKQYQLIKIIIDCICRLLQNKTLFPQIKKRIRNENNINELLNLFLQDKLIIYNIRTHTEKYTGSSQTGDEAGIVDFYFTDSNDNMLFLMEALYVDDPFNAEYVKSHYKKLINAYDQIGRPFHILLMYSLCSEFNESYQKYSNLYKEQQFKPPITSDGCIPIVKEFEQTSEIKVGLSNYERSGNICSIYHIYCNFSQTSLNF